MRGLLVIYDFEFPNIWENFIFFFISADVRFALRWECFTTGKTDLSGLTYHIGVTNVDVLTPVLPHLVSLPVLIRNKAIYQGDSIIWFTLSRSRLASLKYFTFLMITTVCTNLPTVRPQMSTHSSMVTQSWKYGSIYIAFQSKTRLDKFYTIL